MKTNPKILASMAICFSLNATAANSNFNLSNGELVIPDVTLSEVEILHNIELSLIPNSNPLSFQLKSFEPKSNSIVRSRVLLTGGEETTPVATTGAGFGRVKVNLETGAIQGFVRIKNLSNVTSGHIHQGEKGKNGSPIITLLGESHFMFIPKNTVLSASQITAFKKGELYLNIHTSDNPAGEIRGQLPAGNHRFLRAQLSGTQEVPPVDVDTVGTAVMRLNLNTGRLMGYVQVDDMVVSIGHIHLGKKGENGDVLVTLEEVSFENNVAIHKIPDNTILNKEEMTQLLNAGTYINLHSPDVPSGEVRGQLYLKKD